MKKTLPLIASTFGRRLLPLGNLLRVLAFATISNLALSLAPAQAAEPVTNIVLVHGAFADGSGWRGVADILERDGYKVLLVQEPETSLDDDVTATLRVIKQAGGPVVLVGHSYGGVVITQAGNTPEVGALVYVAAVAPDPNEKPSELRARFAPATNNVVKSPDGFLTLNPANFHDDFAADLPAADAAFMARSQVPISEKAVTASVTQAAWRSKPSWYAVATEDHRSTLISNGSWPSAREAPRSRSRAATRSTCHSLWLLLASSRKRQLAPSSRSGRHNGPSHHELYN